MIIITIESFNLGNRLQNYALQEDFHDLGLEAETIIRVERKVGGYGLCKSINSGNIQNQGISFRQFDNKIKKSKYLVSSEKVSLGIINELFCYRK